MNVCGALASDIPGHAQAGRNLVFGKLIDLTASPVSATRPQRRVGIEVTQPVACCVDWLNVFPADTEVQRDPKKFDPGIVLGEQAIAVGSDRFAQGRVSGQDGPSRSYTAQESSRAEA